MNIINYTIGVKNKDVIDINSLKNNVSAIQNILNRMINGMCNKISKDDIIEDVLKMSETTKMCKKVNLLEPNFQSNCDNNHKYFDKYILNKIYSQLKENDPSLTKMCKSKRIIASYNYVTNGYNMYPVISQKIEDNPIDLNIKFDDKSGGGENEMYVDLIKILEDNEKDNINIDMVCITKNGKLLCQCEGCDEYMIKKKKLKEILMSNDIYVEDLTGNLIPSMLTKEEYHKFNMLYNEFKQNKNI
jgi:hypothetical protein